LQVGGCFADKSISNNKKVKTEDTFVENRNLKTKTEFFSNSLLKQAYRLGQLAKLQVGGCFADKSISNNKKVKTEDTFVENKNLTTKTEIVSDSLLRQAYRLGQLAFPQVGGLFTKSSISNNKQEYSEQSGRILPICAKDTPHFGSDVYKLGTRARKAQADVKNSIQGTRNVRSVGQMRRKFLTTCTIKGTRGGNLQADVLQYGRSMIEMLGVLAIIGVLSVGGIAGYTKAMDEYRINENINEINHVMFGILEHGVDAWKHKNNSTFEYISGETLEALGYLPDGWTYYASGNTQFIEDKLGNEMIFQFYKPYMKLNYHLNSTGNIDETNTKLCQNILLKLARQHSANLYSVWFYTSDDTSGSGHGHYYGDRLCTTKNDCIKDITPANAISICKANMRENKKMTLVLEYYWIS
jgi:hypothetical protein